MPLAPSPAVLRACDVLDHLAAHATERFSVSELARSVGTPRATCDSVLLALAQRGLVHRTPDRRYTLGAGCRVLGTAAATAGAGLLAIEPAAQALARATSSCVAVSSCDGETTQVEQVFDHAPTIAVRTRVGESVPLVPPFGAVFVAWSDAATEAWLDRAGSSLTDQEREHARRALAGVRDRGYAISTNVVRPELVRLLEELADAAPDQSKLDTRDALIHALAPSQYLPLDVDAEGPCQVAQITAPVRDAAGAVAYSLMILGPGYEVRPAVITALGSRLVAAAHDASERLGGVRR